MTALIATTKISDITSNAIGAAADQKLGDRFWTNETIAPAPLVIICKASAAFSA
jgi:hypothetical protein